MITPRQIMELSELDTMLALATGIDSIVDFRERAKALHQYYTGIKESREFCNELIAARIRAERKAGQELLALPKRNGYRPADMGFDGQTPLHGIKKDKAHRWQWIARIPDELFETELLARLGSGDDVTTNYFYEMGRTDKSRKAGINTDRPKPKPDIEFSQWLDDYYHDCKLAATFQDNNPEAEAVAEAVGHIVDRWQAKQTKGDE